MPPMSAHQEIQGPTVGVPTVASRALLRVPEITAWFWVLKGLSTAMGEATSAYLVRTLHPVPAVLLGFVALVGALALQFSMRRYVAWTYWLAVAMVGVFGTMAADVLHVGFHVPYIASSLLYAVALAAVFVVWQRSEGNLSIHSIDNFRRETFYWAAVVATFALGTAVGDMTATTLHLGYWLSAVMFAGAILIPALGYRFFRLNSIFAFWFAYVLTRPLGASVADWMAKPANVGGLAWGDARVTFGLCLLLLCGVAYVVIAQPGTPVARPTRNPPPPASSRSVPGAR